MSFPLINVAQFFDSSGAPLAAGTVEFKDPTTNAYINTYPTADDADAQTNANDNPLTLNARGEAPTGIYLEDGVKYKIILKDSEGATIWTQDDVLCPIALPYLQTSAESAAGVTPTNVEYPPGDVRRYGATGDGTTDDTTALQNALDASAGANEVIVPAGTYMVEAVTANVNIPSNTTLRFLAGAEWKAITNSSDSYIVMDIRDVTNVWIYDPIITGERTTHTGSTGEQGHCLNISSSGTTDNINILNPRCTDAWGDGIVIRNGVNINIHNAYCDNNRRNGITINKGQNICFSGRTTSVNTNGTAPEAGVDIEPNDATGLLENIVFESLYTGGNTGAGMVINIGDFADGGNDREITVTVHEHVDDGSIYGFNLEKLSEGATETITGTIRFKNQTYLNNGSCGMYLLDYSSDNSPHVIFDKPVIINPNANDSTSLQFGAGITVDRKSGSGATNDIGNITIVNPTIVDNRATTQMTRGISAVDNDTSGASLDKLRVIDPIEITGYDAAGDAVQFAMKGGVVTDAYDQVARVLAGSLTVTSRAYSKLSTSNGVLFTVTDGITRDNAGLPLTLETTGAGGIRFDPEASRQVYPLSTTAGKYVESTSVGGRLKIQYNATDDTWYVLEQIGTWSVEP